MKCEEIRTKPEENKPLLELEDKSWFALSAMTSLCWPTIALRPLMRFEGHRSTKQNDTFGSAIHLFIMRIFS